MPNLTVAVLAPNDYAKDLGKKGTVSDLTFYNLKKGEDTVTFIEPTRYPEKLSSLFFALSMADSVLLVIDEINASFGECVLEIQCTGLKKGRMILKNYITVDQLVPPSFRARCLSIIQLCGRTSSACGRPTLQKRLSTAAEVGEQDPEAQSPSTTTILSKGSGLSCSGVFRRE